MCSTSSVSEGCFAFKNEVKQKKTKSRSSKIESLLTEEELDEMWYKSFKLVWTSIESEIRSIQNEDLKSVLSSLVNFVETNDEVLDNLLPTAVLLTGINQTDHYDQFDRLATELKDKINSEVVILKSRDCPNLKTAFQKLVSQIMEKSNLENENCEQKCLRRSEYTMKTLEAWFLNKMKLQKNFKNNLVIILPDFELFNQEIFKKIIIILNSYRQTLPIVLVIGVATSLSALQNALPARVINSTKMQVFHVEPSASSLNKIVEKVLLSPMCPFHLSGRAFQLLVDIFLFYDFSVNSFIQALKHCVIQHFSQGKIFSLCSYTNSPDTIFEELSSTELEQIRRLPSCREFLNNEPSENVVGFFLSDDFLASYVGKFITMIKEYWYNFYCGLEILKILFQDLPENLFGKHIRNLYVTCISKELKDLPEFKQTWTLVGLLSKSEILLKLKKIISFLNFYRYLIENTEDDHQVSCYENFLNLENKLIIFHQMIEEAGLSSESSTATTTESNNLNQDNSMKNIKNRQELKEKLLEMSKNQKIKIQSDFSKSYEDCMKFIETEIIQKFIKPSNRGPPLIELFVFGDTMSIKRHIIGTQRAAVHTALTNPNYYLMCKCCELDDLSYINPTLPDISIAYKLHLESAKMINLYDWMQAYRTIIDPSDEEQHIDPKIQAAFTRAVSELEFLGFVKSTKRKADHVAKLTW